MSRSGIFCNQIHGAFKFQSNTAMGGKPPVFRRLVHEPLAVYLCSYEDGKALHWGLTTFLWQYIEENTHNVPGEKTPVQLWK